MKHTYTNKELLELADKACQDANKNLRAKFKPEVKEANARAEKAETELANALQTIGLITTCAPKVVMNPNNLFSMAQEICNYVATLGLPQLRPIAEAGPVPEGCVRFYCWEKEKADWIPWGELEEECSTHFADIRLPAEPKLFCAPFDSFSEKFQEAVKPQPETFEAHGKTWTKHTPGDAMPCDGEKLVTYLFTNSDEWKTKVPAREVRWSKYDSAGDIIGWRYADEPTPETLEAEPWTPKVGDVVTLKSGGPKMVINHISDEGVYCSWFNESEVLIKTHIKALPTACLQPA